MQILDPKSARNNNFITITLYYKHKFLYKWNKFKKHLTNISGSNRWFLKRHRACWQKHKKNLYLRTKIFENFIIGISVSVQAEVEKPITYLLARCPASSLQLCYSDIRLEDTQRWNSTFVHVKGIEIKDSLRYFKGKYNLTLTKHSQGELSYFIHAMFSLNLWF